MPRDLCEMSLHKVQIRSCLREERDAVDGGFVRVCQKLWYRRCCVEHLASLAVKRCRNNAKAPPESVPR